MKCDRACVCEASLKDSASPHKGLSRMYSVYPLGNRLRIIGQLSTIIGCCCSTIALSFPAAAQLTPDDTLGDERSVVTPQGLRDLIEGGAIRHSNLFHSFQEFNVNPGQRVYFANPQGIMNILTRVTGNNISQIFGTLGIDGNANLFLLNPNGIVFGENASLDIRGSFLATTVDRLNFDNYQFSATNADTPPLLTINLTPGVQLGGQAIGLQPTAQSAIANRGELKVGRDFTLAAGNLDLQGQLLAGNNLTLLATDAIKIRDSLDRPFIASAGKNLSLQGNNRLDIFALNHSNSGLFAQADLILESNNTIVGDAHFHSGGDFKTNNHLSSPNDPIILAGGDVSLDDYTGASLHILAGGQVRLADVTINAPDTSENSINPENTTLFNGQDTIASLSEVTLSGDRTVTIDGSQQPTLDVRAGIDWSTFEGGAPGKIEPGNLQPTVQNNPTSADIQVDLITIADGGDGGNLLLTNQYRPNSNLTGDLFLYATIDAKDRLQGGNLNFDSRGGITVSGLIDASTIRVDRGDGGDISLWAKEDIQINDGASIVSNGLTSGNILLSTQGDISLTGTNNGALIQSNSFILEPDLEGGKVTIISNLLELRDGATIDTNIFGTAQVNNSSIFQPAALSVENTAEDNPGDIQVDTGSIFLDNGSISASTNSGVGSNITLQVAQFLILDRNSRIVTRAGNADLAGNGGNINIDSQFIIGFSQGSNDIIANAIADNSGNININSQQIFGFDSISSNDINAATQLNLNEEIAVKIRELDPLKSIIKLPTTLVDTDQKIVRGCSWQSGEDFVFKDRGGLPTNPIEELPEEIYLQGFETENQIGVRNTELDLESTSDIKLDSLTPIIEAENWLVNERGKIELVAQKKQKHNLNWQNQFDCK